MTKLNLLRPLSFLLLRVMMGAAMMAHGLPKLTNTERFLEIFSNLGFPGWTVYLVAVLELFGGALVALGLFTRYAAFLISGHMAVAFLVVHWKLGANGLFAFLGHSGDEYPLILSLAFFLLATTGAEKFSLDWVIFRDKA